MKRKHFHQSTTLAFCILTALLLTEALAGDIENTLRRGGAVSGRVVEASTGAAVPLVEIQLWNESGEYRDGALTDMHGRYRIEELPAGRYFAATLESGYADELYLGRPCPYGECDPTAGTPIEVRGGAVTGSVDFVLER